MSAQDEAAAVAEEAAEASASHKFQLKRLQSAARGLAASLPSKRGLSVKNLAALLPASSSSEPKKVCVCLCVCAPKCVCPCVYACVCPCVCAHARCAL